MRKLIGWLATIILAAFVGGWAALALLPHLDRLTSKGLEKYPGFFNFVGHNIGWFLLAIVVLVAVLILIEKIHHYRKNRPLPREEEPLEMNGDYSPWPGQHR